MARLSHAVSLGGGGDGGGDFLVHCLSHFLLLLLLVFKKHISCVARTSHKSAHDLPICIYRKQAY